MIVTICTVLIFVTFVAKIYYRHSIYMKNIPKLDLARGSAFDFLRGTEAILPSLQKYIETYGPIIKLYLGPIHIGVIASDEKFLDHILNSNQLIDKPDQFEFVHNWLGTGLLTSTGEKWSRRRKLLTPAFHFKVLSNFVSIFSKNGDILMQKLEQEVGKASFNVHPMISLFTLDSICETAMGVSLDAQRNETSEYIKSVKIMSKIATERTFLPLPTFLYPLTPNYYKERRALKILHGHTDRVIDKKLKEWENRDVVNEMIDDVGAKKKLAFLDLLIRQSKIEAENLSRSDIREEVDTFMFAGHDSTASAISFALFALANNPEVQLKAFEEQRQIFGNDKCAVPNIATLKDMKYLQCVVFETLRLYPPFPFLGRQIKEEYEWEGNIFPKNTNVLLLTFGNMKDDKYFPGEPNKFRPERFQNLTCPNIFVPFSAGPRNCLGQKFAILEMKTILSKILRNFELLPATPVHEPRFNVELVMVSKNGVCIAIKKRVYK